MLLVQRAVSLLTYSPFSWLGCPTESSKLPLINKRNVEDFNRFRLVLLAEKPTDFAEEASAIFQSLGADDKIHLHVVSKDDFPALNVRS